MKKISRLISMQAFFVLTSYFSTDCIYYQYQQFIHPDTGTTLHFFSDAHFDLYDQQITLKQSGDLFKFAGLLEKPLSFIVEDMSYYSIEKEGCTAGYMRDVNIESFFTGEIIRITPLLFSTLGYSLAGFDVENAECRYNDKRVEKALDEISGYNDSIKLNWYYQEVIQSVKSFKNIKNNPALRSLSQESLSNIKIGNESQLVNAKIIHHIYNSRNIKNIIVLAGGSHILQVNATTA